MQCIFSPETLSTGPAGVFLVQRMTNALSLSLKDDDSFYTATEPKGLPLGEAKTKQVPVYLW